MGIWFSFAGVNWMGVRMTTHHHLVLRLRMSGAVLSFHMYAFAIDCSFQPKVTSAFTVIHATVNASG